MNDNLRSVNVRKVGRAKSEFRSSSSCPWFYAILLEITAAIGFSLGLDPGRESLTTAWHDCTVIFRQTSNAVLW